MIVTIQGTLVAASPVRAVIEAGGIGYEVHIPVTTAEKLPAAGSTVKLHTLAIYREDSQALYGFAGAAERDFFRLLVETVSGVGPKVALSILSKLSLPVLRSAIIAGDINLLTKCQGIGRKTAERLVVELRDKLPGAGAPLAVDLSPAGAGAAGGGTTVSDAVAALVALGYKVADADKAVRKAAQALGPGAGTEALIKGALG